MIDWGKEIAVDGVRPEWLDDNDKCKPHWVSGEEWYPTAASASAIAGWSNIDLIRLPSDHAYYLATSKGFTYWPGGKVAPDDWTVDPNDIIYRDGIIGQGMGRMPFVWRHFDNPADIIGYKRKGDSFDAAFSSDLSVIPAWAIARVKELYVDKEGMAASFARYIMSKEEPPVDPDLIEAREVVCQNHHDKHPESPWHAGQAENVRAGNADHLLEVIQALAGIKRGRALERGE